MSFLRPRRPGPLGRLSSHGVVGAGGPTWPGKSSGDHGLLKAPIPFRRLAPTMTIASITRENVLGFRQRATFLHRRLPPVRLVEAAFAGLQDSAPRSAVLALHARVKDVSPSAWKDPRFAQLWGPRGAVYVVPRHDVAVFTLGRFPRDPVLGASVRAAAEKAKRAFRIRKTRPDRGLSDRALGVNFRELRIASITGALRIEWDGATTSWWLVDPPTEAPESARLELARRFLRSVGPSTPEEFAWWSAGGPDGLVQPHAGSSRTRNRPFGLSKRN